MEAVILAGGRGTRLAGTVPNLPKPMAPIAGRPFLFYLLHSLEAARFTRVILSTGYLGDVIQQHFGTRFGDIELVYSHEESPLGTGGAINAALQHTLQDHVFVVNGDTLADVDYAVMLAAHLEQRSSLSIALLPVPDAARYGAVQTTHGRITGFIEKGRYGPGTINAGVYLLDKALLSSLDLPQRFSFEEEVLLKRFALILPTAFPIYGYFIDIGIPEDYARAQRELLQQFPPLRP